MKMKTHNLSYPCNSLKSVRFMKGSALMITAVVVMTMVVLSGVFLADVVNHTKMVDNYETNYQLHYAADSGLEQVKYLVTTQGNSWLSANSSTAGFLAINNLVCGNALVNVTITDLGTGWYQAISTSQNGNYVAYSVAMQIKPSQPTPSPYSDYIQLQNDLLTTPLYSSLIRGDIFSNTEVQIAFRYKPDNTGTLGPYYPQIDGSVYTPDRMKVNKVLTGTTVPPPHDWLVTGQINGARPWLEQDVWRNGYWRDLTEWVPPQLIRMDLIGNDPAPRSNVIFPTVANVQLLRPYAQNEYLVSYDNPFWKDKIDAVTVNGTYDWKTWINFENNQVHLGVQRYAPPTYDWNWSGSAGVETVTLPLPANEIIYSDKDIKMYNYWGAVVTELSGNPIQGRVTMVTPGNVLINSFTQSRYVDQDGDTAYIYNPNPNQINQDSVGYYEPNPLYNPTAPSVLGIVAGASISQRQPGADTYSNGVLMFSGICATGAPYRTVTDFIGSMTSKAQPGNTPDLGWFYGASFRGGVGYDNNLRTQPPPFFSDLYSIATTGAVSNSTPTFSSYRRY